MQVDTVMRVPGYLTESSTAISAFAADVSF